MLLTLLVWILIGLPVQALGIHSRLTAFASRATGAGSFDDDNLSIESDADQSTNPIRYRARVAYDGSRFHGWQYQPNRRTIQGELEEVLSRRFDRKIRLVGAGRTDTGVHARGQAIHFDLRQNELGDSEADVKLLERSLNRMLSQEIRVWNVGRAPEPVTKMHPTKQVMTTFPWHVIYNAEQKLYSYRLCVAPSMDPLERHFRHHVDWGNLDLDSLARILSLYEGTHDFRAFAGAVEQKEKDEGKPIDTVRTVYKSELVCEDEMEGLYRIDILLKGALYKQVRNMIGTAIEVCRGRLDEQVFRQLLFHVDKNDEKLSQFVRDDNPCKPAPPEGLTLERVFYEGDF